MDLGQAVGTVLLMFVGVGVLLWFTYGNLALVATVVGVGGSLWVFCQFTGK